MKEIVGKITETIAVFTKEAAANLDGNKAAGVRARKASMELEKLMKEFRRASLDESKK